jgi:hypothetical protein
MEFDEKKEIKKFYEEDEEWIVPIPKPKSVG